MWYEKIIENLSEPQIINDSKTPSGRVHVGSLRGVLIHDAIYRALRDKGVDVTYKFGIDDYDPLDGLPSDASGSIVDYMGFPLCNIPAPEGSDASDLANHYIAEFLDIFKELGVGAQIYKMRDVYRSGQFNEAIDTILRKADVVRQIYLDVSNSVRPDNWHPFQVICEKCGKIGTSEVTAYDGKEVTYECRKDLVKWATGCGYKGKVSPFDGNGKMPWKLEWTAKWHTFGITIEGAGKDHCTKGGSRDVGEACLKAIFGHKPPMNVPYEFFLVSGAKMSSSKGVGTAARSIADFLPPEILRFLMVQTPPKRTVNFSTDFDYIVKLFNEHDRLVETVGSGRGTEKQQKTLQMIEVNPASTAYHPVGFQLLTALLQLPHLELESEIDKRTEGGLSAEDKSLLQKRIATAKFWLDNYASAEDRVELQQTLPASAAALTATQKAFLNLLGQNFPELACSDDAYQSYVFHTARLTPISQKDAFAAIYCVLLDKSSGPKAGSLFGYLDRSFLVKRFLEVGYSRDSFWTETGIGTEDCADWFEQNKDKISHVSAAYLLNVCPSIDSDDRKLLKGKTAIEIKASLSDNKTYLSRVLFSDFENEAPDLAAETAYLQAYGKDFIAELAANSQVSIETSDEVLTFNE